MRSSYRNGWWWRCPGPAARWPAGQGTGHRPCTPRRPGRLATSCLSSRTSFWPAGYRPPPRVRARDTAAAAACVPTRAVVDDDGWSDCFWRGSTGNRRSQRSAWSPSPPTVALLCCAALLTLPTPTPCHAYQRSAVLHTCALYRCTALGTPGNSSISLRCVMWYGWFFFLKLRPQIFIRLLFTSSVLKYIEFWLNSYKSVPCNQFFFILEWREYFICFRKNSE